MVALRLALDAPDRVERLALLSAAAGRTEEERQRVLERLAIVEHGIPGEHFRRSLSRWFSDDFRRANPELLSDMRRATWRMIRTPMRPPITSSP